MRWRTTTDDGLIGGTRSQQEQEKAKVERSVNRLFIAVIMVYSLSSFPMIILLATVTIHELYDKDIAQELQTALHRQQPCLSSTRSLTLSYKHTVALIFDKTFDIRLLQR